MTTKRSFEARIEDWGSQPTVEPHAQTEIHATVCASSPAVSQ
jgi:hypothetical protein